MKLSISHILGIILIIVFVNSTLTASENLQYHESQLLLTSENPDNIFSDLREISLPEEDAISQSIYHPKFIEDKFYYPTGNRFSLTTSQALIEFGISKVAITLNHPLNLQDHLTLSFDNSNVIEPKGMGLEHYSNYFINSEIYTGFKNYNEVWYYNIYHNIDLRFYVNDNGLKYDFIVHPGGNPSDITINIDSDISAKLVIDPLKITFGIDTQEIYSDSQIDVYQNNPDYKIINAHFTSKGGTSYGFSISEFDPTVDLIIDPLIKTGYYSYLGGSGTEKISKLLIDDQENIYLFGQTQSIDFPMVNSYNSTYDASDDCYLVKLNSTLNGIIFSTYFGGDSIDFISDALIDQEGNIVITGITRSSNFPLTLDAFDNVLTGISDSFLFILNETGNGLVFSSLFGGSGDEYGLYSDIDSSGNLILVGATTSDDISTTTGAYSETYFGAGDAIVMGLTSTYGIDFLSYAGGTSDEYFFDVKLDSDDNIYATGRSNSDDAEVVGNVYNATNGGGRDVYLAKFNHNCSSMLYGTYIGGNQIDSPFELEIDQNENIIIAGYTRSPNFPTFHGVDMTFNGTQMGFVASLNISSGNLVYSTFIGGSSDETIYDMILDSTGDVIVSGHTSSSDFPVVDSPYQTLGGTLDTFVARVNSTGNGMVYSSYMGGSGNDKVGRIVENSKGEIIIVYETNSDDLPVSVDAFDDTYNADYDIGIGLIRFDPYDPDVNFENSIYVEYGDEGTVVWTMGDKYPNYYTIELEQNILVNATPWNNGTFSYNFGQLELGNYTLRISVYDNFLRISLIEVLITVQDNTPPNISNPEYLIYLVGETENSISWTISDLHPMTIVATRNGTTVFQGNNLSNQVLTLNVDNLHPGVYYYTIFVLDIWLNTNTSTIIVIVSDNEPPTISHPSDLTMVAGDFNPTISWDINDAYPDYLRLTQDGELIDFVAEWSVGTYVVSLNDLPPGRYIFELFITDTSGNIATDVVWVTVIVLGSDDTTTGITTTDDTSSKRDDTEQNAFLPFPIIAVYVGLVITTKKRRLSQGNKHQNQI